MWCWEGKEGRGPHVKFCPWRMAHPGAPKAAYKCKRKFESAREGWGGGGGVQASEAPYTSSC